METNDNKYGVCAWCRCAYDKVTGLKLSGHPLPDREYAFVVSHGMCKQCKDGQFAAERGELSTARDFAVIIDTCTMDLLEGPHARLQRAINLIIECEGPIPKELWCKRCKTRIHVTALLLRAYRREHTQFETALKAATYTIPMKGKL
jgi:hypothetical protein